MRQVVQPASGGEVEVLEVPRPAIGPAEVLVRTLTSVVSPGTERAVTSLARASLLSKARARPDLVRQVARKARAEGPMAASRAVRERLAGDVALGYSAAGVVTEVGPAVDGLRTGQLVATGGAGKACHAEFQAVPALLCTPVPDGVSAEDAALATIASIPLHALRLAGAEPGAKVVVIGLGLIGQLAVRLARASGCGVVGIDISAHARDVAASSGAIALDERGDATTRRVLAWSRGRGADAVLVCAADKSSRAVVRCPALCRDRGSVVVVGDVGLDLPRTPFYERELSLLFARSYGPGRYEPSYEEWGVDYPACEVRWTEGRNAEAVLDLLAAGSLTVSDLVTHEFGIAEADAAYQVLQRHDEPCLAIRLSYPAEPGEDLPIRLTPVPSEGVPVRRTSPATRPDPGVGLIGAGAFATTTLLPTFRDAGFERFVAVATASGLSARRAAGRHGFEKAATGATGVIEDPDVDVVVVATPHDVHTELTVAALRTGRHVWCEKPAALTFEGADEIEKAWWESGRELTLGFNRRWAPALLAARQVLAATDEPKMIVYRVCAGRLPAAHWYRDRRQGGRLLGEVCHFVDAAQALAGAEIEDATGLAGGCDDASLSLRFRDGSLACIAYASAHPAAGKEWVEVSAGGHRLVIDDFRSVRDGRDVLWQGRRDKGHRGHAAAFRAAVTGGPPMPTAEMLATMRATLLAAERAAGHD